eukprot:m.32627 g.32627  ORF g.32627 m.32627 type:complete len:73 (+) comp10809_c2_seq1:166-384(+)
MIYFCIQQHSIIITCIASTPPSSPQLSSLSLLSSPHLSSPLSSVSVHLSSLPLSPPQSPLSLGLLISKENPI